MVSLTYSLALVTLTIAVLFGHLLFARWSAGRFVLLICSIAALGALIAAIAPSLVIVWLGYSLLFGGANGLGYGFGLQIAAQANAGREGTSMGIVTAAYALGAAISPALFILALSHGGFRVAMLGLVAALMVVALICAMLLHASRTVFRSGHDRVSRSLVLRGKLFLLWLGYGTGVAGGLMAIGHAAGIASSLNYDGPAWTAPAVIAVCNLAGALIAGRLIDRLSVVGLLAGLPLLSTGAVTVLAIFGGSGLVMICFGVVGFAYGGIIAAYPAAISKMFGVLNGTRVYGRVFTAWGCAGLLSPWLAGSLFDWTGSYQIALLTAGVLGIVSVCSMLLYFLPRPAGA